MFIANIQFETPLMSALGSTGDRYFRTVHLSNRLPWFVVTVLLHDGEKQLFHSVCCVSTSDLVGMLAPGSDREVKAIQQMSPAASEDGRWEMRDVGRIWQANHPAGHQVLVLEDMEGFAFSGEPGMPARTGFKERELLFESPYAASDSNRHPAAKRWPQPVRLVRVPVYTGALDPQSFVTDEELGVALGDVSAKEVRRREDAGMVIAVGGASNRYPMYQAMPEIAGGPFEHLLMILRGDESPRPHVFFISESPDLGWLSPVEALIGAAVVDRDLRLEAALVVAADAATRHRCVASAAKAFVAARSGW